MAMGTTAGIGITVGIAAQSGRGAEAGRSAEEPNESAAVGRQTADAEQPAVEDGKQAAGTLESAAVGRRAAGALEAAVLGVLWDAAGALSPGEVRTLLARTDSAASSLSYSTVVTILTRLHEKGSLSRERDGRAYRYAPVADEAGLAARRLSQLLDRSANREAVLSRFVADLSERDEELLRSLLGESAPEGDEVSADGAMLFGGAGTEPGEGLRNPKTQRGRG